jgi:hypothetical protein
MHVIFRHDLFGTRVLLHISLSTKAWDTKTNIYIPNGKNQRLIIKITIVRSCLTKCNNINITLYYCIILIRNSVKCLKCQCCRILLVTTDK